MTVDAKIVGYDRSSDVIAVEVELPASALNRVKKIADVPATDPDLVGAYPLTERQLAMIAEAAHITVEPNRFQYFLEAYEE